MSSPVLYGSRITLYRQALNSFVVSTSSAEAPVGVMEHDPVNGKRLPFEQAVFVVKTGDPAGSSSANRSVGDTVKYGQTVCLEHLARQQPLCCHMEQHAIGLKGNLRVLLEKQGRSTLKVDRWRVMPRYRLRVEGEPVLDGDPVLLQSVSGEHFLNSADGLDDEMGPDNTFIEVSCGSEMQGFQMRVYDGDVGPKFADTTLRCGDCITLFHTEERKYVNADLTSKRCLLKSPDSQDGTVDSGTDGGSDLGTVGARKDQPSDAGEASGRERGNRGGPGALTSRRLTNSDDISYLTLFILENADPSRGGAVRARGRALFRLKSMSTGLYLRTGVEAVPDAIEHGAKASLPGENETGSPSSPLKGFEPFPNAMMSNRGAEKADSDGEEQEENPDAAEADYMNGFAPQNGRASRKNAEAAAKQGLRNVTYQLTLTNDASASGTLFRLQSASASASEFLLSGSHIFIEAPSTDNGRLFLVSGGPAATLDGNSQMTVGSLSQTTTSTGVVTFYGRPIKSMRDGLEVRRLRPKLLQELSVIRSYIPPLERYAFNMLRGVGDPYRLREVKENLHHLIRLCELRSDTAADGAPDELASRHNVTGNMVDVVWQSKLFHQGVPALVLQVVYATLKCPHVNPQLLYTSEMVSAPPPGGISPLVSSAAASSRPRFVPVRYTELAELVDGCFGFLAMLVSGRPQFAQSLLPYSDFILNCSAFIPQALQCLTHFYTNNAVFVELPMAKPRLTQFLQLLAERPRDPAVIEAVRLFALCGEESMMEAQQVILDFFSDATIARAVLAPIALRTPQDTFDTHLLDLDAMSSPSGSPRRPDSSQLPRATTSVSEVRGGGPLGGGASTVLSTGSRQEAEAQKWVELLRTNEPMLVVGLPNSIFVEPQSSEAMSITVSTQFRGRPNILGRLLQHAADLESGEGVTWFPLEGLQAVAGDWTEIGDIFLPYFVEQIRLLAALAAGRNATAAGTFIPPWVPAEALLAALKSKCLPPALHAALTDLFTHTQVNVSGSMQVKENIRNVRRVVTETAADKSADSGLSVFVSPHPPSCFVDAKAYVFAHLERAAVSSDDDIAVEFAATLRLTEALLNGGAFTFNEYAPLATLLTNVLDPNTDDYRYYIHTKSVHDCKAHTLRILNAMMDILLARNATQLVDTFRQDREPPYVSQLYQLTPSPPPYEEERAHLLAGKTRSTCCACMDVPCRECHECCAATSDCLRGFFGLPVKPRASHSDDDEEEVSFELGAELLRTLMQLANTTQSTRLRSLAIFFFFRLTSGPEQLLRTASRVQLLTSSASEVYFSTVNRVSAQMASLLRKSFRRSNTVSYANRMLAALDAFLDKEVSVDNAEEDEQANILAEKLTMVRRVGLHMGLLQMLQRLPLPLTDTTRATINHVFALMSRMRLDAVIVDDLKRDMDLITPLAWHQTNLLGLLRTFFLTPAAQVPQETVSRRVIADVVHCLSTPHTLIEGAMFLTDYLADPQPQDQQTVWRCLVSDSEAARVVQFRHHWCGPQGQRLRETALTSSDAYKANGRFARHAAVCALLYVVTERNDLVKPEEVRHEVFGLNSVDTLMEVTSDSLLPAFFRNLYLPLVKTLVLEDKTAVPVLIAHRNFPLFLRTCALDLARYLQLIGGTCYSPDLEEELSRQEEMALMAPPSTAAEANLDRQRFGVETYESLVTGPLWSCMSLICSTFSSSVERLNSRLRSQLTMSINEVLDMLCDVVYWALDPATSAPAKPTMEASRISLGETMRPASQPPRAAVKPKWSATVLSRLVACLSAAKSENFQGSARWRGDGFVSICDLAQNAFNSAGGSAAAAPSRRVDGAQKTALGVLKDTASDSDANGNAGTLVTEDDSDQAKKEARNMSESCASTVSSSDEMLSTRWNRFLDDAIACAAVNQPDSLYIAAAGILLRTGDYGITFLQTLLRVLPHLEADHVTRVLQMLRQIVLLRPGSPLDDSVCLPFEQRTYEMRGPQLSTSMSGRQAFLARWPGDSNLEFPLPVIGLVTEYVGSGFLSVRRAALRASVTLLKNGHRPMQESYYTHCIRTSDEQLFFVLRNHMATFTEELRSYFFARQRGSKPADAARFLPSRVDIVNELRLLQLLCAGQFAPLQTYLASQPDNTISVNLIESLVELLSMAPRTADEVTFTFYQQLLATLTETLQGPCRVNQDTVVAYRAADYLTQLFAPQLDPPHPKAVLTAYENHAPHHKRDARKRRKDAEKDAEKEAKRRKREEKKTKKKGKRIVGDGTVAVIVANADDVNARETALLLTTTSSRPLAAVRRDCLTRIQGNALACLLALLEGRQEPLYARKLLATVDLMVLAESMDASADEYELLHGPVDRAQSKGFASGDFTNSFRVLRRYFSDYFHNDFPDGTEELQDELSLAVSIYTFFRACFDMQHLALGSSSSSSSGTSTATATTTAVSGPLDDFLDKRGRSVRDVLKRTRHYLTLHSKVAKVEIVRGGALERAYFRVLSSSVDNLGAERREEVIRNAVRTSDNERIQYFFHRAWQVMVEMNVYNRVRRHVVLYFLNYFSRELILLVLLIVIALNVMMIVGLRQPISPYTDQFGTDEIILSINALGIALIAVQGILVLQSLFGPATITVTTRWQGWRSRREERIAATARKDIAGDVSEYLAADKKLHSRPWYEFIVRSFVYIVTDVTLFQQLFFLAVAILGFVHNRIWYSIQLLQISLWTPSLNNLFRALAANFSSLLLTFVLLLIVIFIFAIISFFKFSQLFDPLGLRGNGFNCYTLSQCWLVHIDTLRNSGGVGDVSEWPTYYSKDGFGYWFTFFRLAYYVVAVLVVTNLFLGVIVDSLARFRMEQEFVTVDQTKKCFICGQERNLFDVWQPGAYDTHISEEHNMWQYVYFLHYLSKKDPSTFTGQEEYVYHLVQHRDITFFPIGRSLVLSAFTNSGDENGDADAEEAARRAAEEERQTTVDALDSGIRKAVDPVNKKLDETQDVLARMMSTLLQLQQMQNHLADQTPSISTSSSGSLGFYGGGFLGGDADDDDDAAAAAGASGPPGTARSVNSSLPFGTRRDADDRGSR